MALRFTLTLLALVLATVSAQDVCPVDASQSVCSVVRTNGQGPKNRRVCGKTGTLRRETRVQPPCTAASFKDCRDSCLAEGDCASFSFDSPTAACTLYSKTARAQGFRPSNTSTTSFYNRNCYKFQPCPKRFHLQVVPSGTAFDNYYVGIDAEPVRTDQVNLRPDVAEATVFNINDEGVLRALVDGATPYYEYTEQSVGLSTANIYEATASEVERYQLLLQLPTCALTSDSPPLLVCDNGYGDIWSGAGSNALALGATNVLADFTLQALAV